MYCDKHFYNKDGRANCKTEMKTLKSFKRTVSSRVGIVRDDLSVTQRTLTLKTRSIAFEILTT